MNDLPTGSTVAEVLERYKDRKKYIILNENVAQMEASPFFKVYAVEMNFAETDWYNTGSSYSLMKPALMRVCSALSISIISSVRTDNNSNPDFANYNVIGAMRMPDGTPRTMAGSKSFDVNEAVEDAFKRAQSGRAKRWDTYKDKSDAQLREMAESQRGALRKAKAERAETGAMERMIRAMGAMSTGYKKEDTTKTFVALVTTPDLDKLFMDPAIRQAAALQAVGAASQLYGMAPGQVPAPPEITAGDQPDQKQLSAGAADQDAPPPPASQPDPDAPPVDPDEARIDEWEAASQQERNEYITRLWQERIHGFKAEQWRKIMNSNPRKQAEYIVMVFEKRPKVQEQNEQSQDASQQRDAGQQGAPGWEPSQAQINRLLAIGGKCGYDEAKLHALISERYNGISSFKDLTREQYDELCGNDRYNISSWLEANPYKDPNQEDMFNGNTGGKDEDLPF